MKRIFAVFFALMLLAGITAIAVDIQSTTHIGNKQRHAKTNYLKCALSHATKLQKIF